MKIVKEEDQTKNTIFLIMVIMFVVEVDIVIMKDEPRNALMMDIDVYGVSVKQRKAGRDSTR